MWLLGLIVVLLLVGGSSISTRADMMEATEDMKRRGCFNEDYQAQQRITQDVINDWYSGERKYFPKEYWRYLELNKNARTHYIWHYSNYLFYKAGVKGVPKDYDWKHPMKGFENANLENIKIFNETGKFYF